MKNFIGEYHSNPLYEYDGKTYFKVGPYDMYSTEYIVQADGSIYLPEHDKYYSSLEEAYTNENRLWIENDEDFKDLV